MSGPEWSPADEQTLRSPLSRARPQTAHAGLAMQEPGDMEMRSSLVVETSLDPLDELLGGWDDEQLHEGGAALLLHLDSMLAGDSAVTLKAPAIYPTSSASAAPSAQANASTSSSCRQSISKYAGRGRVPRKIEIRQLREDIPKLEAKLHALREHWKRLADTSEPRDVHKMAPSAASNSALRWKEIASQQRDALGEAQSERARLRSQLQIQKKLTRAIQKLLIARATSVARLRQELRHPLRVDPRYIMPGYASELERVVATSNAMSNDVRRVYEIIASRGRRCAAFRAWAVQQENEQGMFVDFTHSYEVPFGKAHVCRTLQPFLSSLGDDLFLCEYFREVKDLRVRQFVAGFSKPAGSGFVRVVEALNCIHTEIFSVYTVTRVIHRLASTGAPRNVAELVEQFWIIVNEGNRDTDGSSDDTGSPTTMIQSYYIMQYEPVDDGDEGFWTRHTIEQALIPTLDGDFAMLDRDLETALVNEGMREEQQQRTTENTAPTIK